MALWITVLSISYGFVMLLDPLMYTFIAYKLNISSVYLGLCSALWSVFYIVVSMLFGSLADKGRSRVLILISLFCLTISWLLMLSFNLITVFTSYMFHAISMASANLALNAAIFDNVDSYYWSRAILFTRFIGNTIRGFVFIVLAIVNYFDVVIVLQITILSLLLSVMLIPSISLIPERSIYRLYRLTRGIGSYVKASASLLYIDNPGVAQDVFQKVWSRNVNSNLGTSRIATVIMLVTCVGDYILSFLPLIIKNKVSLQILWIAYGITALFSIVILYKLREAEINNKILAIILILIRSTVLILGINVINDMISLTLYLIANSVLFSIIDLVFYNIFVSSTAGYGTSLYYTLRELGSIIGPVLGGFLLAVDMKIYTAIAIAITIASVLLAL